MAAVVTFRAVDPARDVEVGPVYRDATAAEVDAAVRAAEGAFDAYRRTTPETRAGFLRAVAAEIEAVGDLLLATASEETAIPVARLAGERTRTTNQLRMFAALVEEGSWVDARIDRPLPDRRPLPKPDLRRMLVEMGPVAVFAASNLPLAFSVAGGDTASALAAGCPVIVKAHPSHPTTSELVMAALRRAADAAHLPAGVATLLHGTSPAVGLALVRHPLVAAVGFTGSLRAGRALFDAAAARPVPIPVYAEMGSVNPVFVLPGALAERGPRIAEELRTAMTMGFGQFCTSPGVVVGLDDERTRALVDRFGGLVGAEPGAAMLNRGIGRAFAEGVNAFAAAGARVVAHDMDADANPARHTPVVFATDAAHFLATPRLREELFGPATLVVLGRGRAELEEVARALDGQLTATIQAAPGELAEYADLVRILERKAGRLIVNGYPTGVEVCPAMHHGGPYPATTDSRTTSVGTAAIERFARPVAYQNFPPDALPAELRDGNPRRVWRIVDGVRTRD